MADATPADRAAARAFVNGRLTLNTDNVATALRAAYGDSYMAGVLIAANLTGNALTGLLGELAVPSTPADWAAFWDTWTPGNAPAAALLSDGGLADLLDQVDTRIVGITGSLLDGLGNALADGVAGGLGVDEITANLMGYVSDPARAEMIARTETARAVSAASMDGYEQAGIARVDWLASPGACPECEDAAASGPYTLQDAPEQPLHPNCRCSYSPVDPGSAAAVDALSGEGE